MYKVLITSMNVDIICHKYELRMISTSMKRGKEDLEKEEGGTGVKKKLTKSCIMYMYQLPKMIVKCTYCNHVLIKKKKN